MPNPDPALCFPGRVGRGDYCGVRKRELGPDKSPGDGRPMCQCVPTASPLIAGRNGSS